MVSGTSAVVTLVSHVGQLLPCLLLLLWGKFLSDEFFAVCHFLGALSVGYKVRIMWAPNFDPVLKVQ